MRCKVLCTFIGRSRTMDEMAEFSRSMAIGSRWARYWAGKRVCQYQPFAGSAGI
jgi:hypothetical protein